MIDIAIVKTAVSLWEKGFKFWDSRKDRRSKLYDEIYGPLFTKLEPITQCYLEMLSDARKALIEQPPTLQLGEIAQNMINARDKLLISRASITGIAEQYRSRALSGANFSRYRYGINEVPSTVEEAVENFMGAIVGLFASAAEAQVADSELENLRFSANPQHGGGSMGVSLYSYLTSGESALEDALSRDDGISKAFKVRQVYASYASLVSHNISALYGQWGAVAAANHILKTMMKG